MIETIIEYILSLLSGLNTLPIGKLISIFIISMTPILELRGGLIAASLLDINPVISFITCLIGNIIPVPLILWFITPLFNHLKSKGKLKKWIDKIEAKALSKKGKIEKYQFWGLLLFVGIPLPGTGAWTGALIASLLNMDKKKALLAIILGVLLAGIIMMFISYGIISKIF